MKNLFNDLSNQEKQRILEMHGIKRNLIKEQSATGITENECYQITNDADKKIYKVKITKVFPNYAIGDLTDDANVVHSGREISFSENKMSMMYDVTVPATQTETESSKSIKVEGTYQKIQC